MFYIEDIRFTYTYTIYNIQYTIYNIQHTTYNIQYTIYNIQYTYIHVYIYLHMYALGVALFLHHSLRLARRCETCNAGKLHHCTNVFAV